jgi:segregation and condensation protein A
MEQKVPIKFKLEAFEGPLDLLLHLIRSNEVDIFDIPVAKITEQYLSYIEMMKQIDIDIGSEFMVMAATLIHLKTKLMLPQQEDDEDPRAELVERLLEHKQYKEAAGMLSQREERESRVWKAPSSRQKGYVEVEEEFVEVDIFQLISAFQEVMRSIGHVESMEIEHQRISVDEKIKQLTGLLNRTKKVLFSTLVEGVTSKREIVTIFLALLEMVRNKFLVIFQNRNFGEIVLFRRDRAQRILDVQ